MLIGGIRGFNISLGVEQGPQIVLPKKLRQAIKGGLVHPRADWARKQQVFGEKEILCQRQ